MKRFLDDIFKIFLGTTKQLHELFDKINKIHPTLKFTLNHTTRANEPMEDRCSCHPAESIPFLDTSLSIIDGCIDVDIYKKKTDRNKYLLTDSCHEKGVTQNIPYSLSLRIIRICTDTKKTNIKISGT